MMRPQLTRAVRAGAACLGGARELEAAHLGQCGCGEKPRPTTEDEPIPAAQILKNWRRFMGAFIESPGGIDAVALLIIACSRKANSDTLQRKRLFMRHKTYRCRAHYMPVAPCLQLTSPYCNAIRCARLCNLQLRENCFYESNSFHHRLRMHCADDRMRYATHRRFLPLPVLRRPYPRRCPPPSLGFFSKIKAPSTHVPTLQLASRGVQIFRCEKRDVGPVWVFRQPQADLLEPAGKMVGKHGANFSFEHDDGSRLVSTIAAYDEAPSRPICAGFC